MLFDADLRYRIVGPETLPFSGRSASTMVGNTVHELFPEDVVETLEPELRATIDGESRSVDIEDTEEIHHVETRPVELDGERFGVLVTQGVTTERQLARELEGKTERLDEFASTVSHDLRNPLSVAIGHLERYREEGDEAALAKVEGALEQIDELTAGLTTLARYGEHSLDPKPVSLAALAREAWEQIDSRNATLELEDRTITADETQMKILLNNLFRNAVGHGGAETTVRVGPLGDWFYVEDTGSGIPEEDRDRVFDHGFSTGYGGNGIGLTIVERIADAHGLQVAVTESAEGGARFEFRAASNGTQD